MGCLFPRGPEIRSTARVQKNYIHMATFKNRLDFLLHLTDYFHGHWEDPEWGRRVENQVLIHLAISELAAKVSDADLKQAIQGAAQKGIVSAGQVAAKKR